MRESVRRESVAGRGHLQQVPARFPRRQSLQGLRQRRTRCLRTGIPIRITFFLNQSIRMKDLTQSGPRAAQAYNPTHAFGSRGPHQLDLARGPHMHTAKHMLLGPAGRIKVKSLTY